jgi:hypothetical protein
MAKQAVKPVVALEKPADPVVPETVPVVSPAAETETEAEAVQEESPEADETEETEATTAAESDKPADSVDASASSSPAEEVEEVVETVVESATEPEVVQTNVPGGGFSSNFVEPSREKTMVERIAELESRVAALEGN